MIFFDEHQSIIEDKMSQPHSNLYDANYFGNYCGLRYERSHKWLTFFDRIAESIVRDFSPKTVLDCGCAMGFLVEALRDRGVEAFGIDISEYAIGQVREDIKPYCSISSVVNPFPQQYDLIVCIEVLEHLSAEDGQCAIKNICSSSNEVLFSSTPNDFGEATHFNVQTPEYWVNSFILNSFIRDVEYSAEYITTWAMRFRRNNAPLYKVLPSYERKLWRLDQENRTLRNAVLELRNQQKFTKHATTAISEIHDAHSGVVLIISHDVVGGKMAGPGIRYYNLAQSLQSHFPTILAVPHTITPELSGASFKVVSYRRRDWVSIASVVSESDVIIFPSSSALDFPQLEKSRASLVVDAYDPLIAERLSMMSLDGNAQQLQANWLRAIRSSNRSYLMGDFFICASERQRDWLLGLLEANGRINPLTFGEDPSLRQLVDVVPFGLPMSPPQHTHHVLKGVWPGIMESDSVVLWGGGLWPWVDPLTAIKAFNYIRLSRSNIRLIFPGTKHPNPHMANMATHVNASRQLAHDLGLLDNTVFFGDWISYADWPNLLLECDVALTLHASQSLESRLAFRSRVIDYIWAGLPTVATKGDATSELVDTYGLGITVNCGDEQQVAQSILRLLDSPPARDRFTSVQQLLTWDRAVVPLIDFCRQRRHAPDRTRTIITSNGIQVPF